MTSTEKDVSLRALIYGTMKARRVTIKKLSTETGIERTGLGRRLSGEMDFSVKELRAVVRVLGIAQEEIARRI